MVEDDYWTGIKDGPLEEAIRHAKDALSRRMPAESANIHPDMLERLVKAAEREASDARAWRRHEDRKAKHGSN